MKEQLITFETAKLAKEKGFDIESNFAFLREELKPHGIHNNFFREPLNDIIEAPTQSFLQKWLRKKHNIYIEINIDQTSLPKFCYRILKYIDEDIFWINLLKPRTFSDLYYSHEEALEIALQEALESI